MLTVGGRGGIFQPLMNLSLIIPAFNEEKCIASTLEKTTAYLQGCAWEYEVLVVDDGSSDDTVAKVRDFAQDNPRVRCLENGANRGKGYSIRAGVQQAKGRFAGFMDADYKTEISDLAPALAWLEEGWDVVLGDRSLADSQIGAGHRRHRKWGSLLFKHLRSAIVGLSQFGDTQCGFKFFQTEVMRQLFGQLKVNGYMFDVEVLLLAQQAGYRVRTMPVHWQDDPDSRFKPLSGMVRNMGELWRIRRSYL